MGSGAGPQEGWGPKQETPECSLPCLGWSLVRDLPRCTLARDQTVGLRAEKAILPAQGYLFFQICWCQRPKNHKPHPELKQRDTNGANLKQPPPGHRGPAGRESP